MEGLAVQRNKEAKVCNAVTKDVAQFVRAIAAQALEARLSSGQRRVTRAIFGNGCLSWPTG